MDIKNISDVELVHLCAKSLENQSAWWEFFNRFDRRIALYIIRAYNAKSLHSLRQRDPDQRETVRDLVQQVYIRLVEDNGAVLGRFRGRYDGSLYAYLAKIATTVVLDYLRRISAIKREAVMVSLDALLANDEAWCQGVQAQLSVQGPGSSTYRLKERITIQEVICQLEQLLEGEGKRRDILLFILHVFHGFTAREIASDPRFGLTQDQVETTFRRVRRVLRRAIRPEATDRC